MFWCDLEDFVSSASLRRRMLAKFAWDAGYRNGTERSERRRGPLTLPLPLSTGGEEDDFSINAPVGLPRLISSPPCTQGGEAG